MSFSSKHGTSVCTPCASCAKDQVVVQNCTLMWDLKCDKRCYGKDRYYDDDKGDCFPCAKCCQDKQDVVENECKEKLGTGSNMICSFHSSINRCDKSTPFSQEPTSTTNQGTISNDYTSPNQSSKHEHSVPPTAQPSHHFTQTETTKHQDLLITVSISVALILALIGLIIIAVYSSIHKARQTHSYLWCNCNAETGVAEMENGASPTCRVHCKPFKRNLDMVEKGSVKSDKVKCGILPTESREPLLGKGNQEEMACSCQQGVQEVSTETGVTDMENGALLTCGVHCKPFNKGNPESKLLSSLLDDAPYLETISECLDTTLAGAGNYRAVAQNYGLNHYTISSVLEKGNKGPTTALIESLAATHTKLTVQEFAVVVKQKAKRNDVVELLEAYDSGKKLEDVKRGSN
ncbi:uncharacterized protein LOC110043442 isoform X1 [Orbicella faveolata]|uniref:uncharacterized protein LOC110043442 isoform X1 n=1 Tax=Orbicella faveolata TaxID=48498 RepID=UPI0009E516D1|nr:uncharacterized protein LOC110043442 isoform X1 [Orbicella faveolata]